MERNYYYPELGINGTIDQLLTWAYRYDEDYTDEALDKIAELAKAENVGNRAEIPLLVKTARERDKQKNSIPYEWMKIDWIVFGDISYAMSNPFGEDSGVTDITIYSESEMVLVLIEGCDETGPYTAANKVTIEDFIKGEADYLDNLVGQTLFYGKIYEEN